MRCERQQIAFALKQVELGMHVNQKPRRRHSELFKAQVLAACGEPGASISVVALSFGVNANLVHQWRRGRGFKAIQAVAPAAVSKPAAQFVALSLPPPPTAPATPAEAIPVELKRGALVVCVVWPIAAAAFAVDVRHVRQRLALAKLHPELMALFRARKIGMDAAKAFTCEPDPARQLAVWKKLPAYQPGNGHQIRHA